MKIVQIGSQDLIGQRFNGQYITQLFNSRKINCHHLVWEKSGNDPDTSRMFTFRFQGTWAKIIGKLEYWLGLRAILQLWTVKLLKNEIWQSADIVHFHLLQWPQYFSILLLPALTRGKRAFWTIHDCWPFTGHCLYPFDCRRFELGCGKCPYLKTDFAIPFDTTSLNWKLKRWIYSRSSFDIIVASKFMFNMVTRSPLFAGKKVHLVPFGLDLAKFKPASGRNPKRYFGISDDTIVIAFRSAPGQFKGLDHLKFALSQIQTNRRICLLTFNRPGQVDEFRDRFQVVDLGWIDDEDLTIAAYQAADFFVMPSTQEAFGMMAMEAMACGRPCIVYSGTSLPEVSGAPEAGVVVPQGDRAGLARAIEKMIEDDEFRLERGRRSRHFAEKHYDVNSHFNRLNRLYQGLEIDNSITPV